ncbi:MAG: hypothetical protein NTZ54_19000 [Alphaproteobacteria bacterium]|nr:hypothetical protein [Alphaproteobacteria bacterium]
MIEIKLDSPEQLLNSFDPSPFRSRDLDDSAADYIVQCADEAGSGEPLRLIIELPLSEAARDLTRELPAALHNSFSYRADRTRHELRELFRMGRLSLAIGLIVLAACMLVIQFLERSAERTTLVRMTEQGLFIVGWVAIWRPFEIFFYDWWPLKHRINLLDRLSTMTVDIRKR